ncbi:PD-(D/E)XK nuclease family protein [Algiphilus sp.]|uniref:PD-(D/E)XK nuclease family protein n=1 Tax=Algiphilus sp. TaxID=1872431 RepID=UPI003BAB3DA0
MVALPRRDPRHNTIAAIDAAVEAAEKCGAPRGHLGASEIGNPCDRALWYSFRWAAEEEFSGRMLRLFERGQREEDSLSDLLRWAGVEVQTIDPETGEQYRHRSVGGHFSGGRDGYGLGLKEAPKAWHVLEYKTHNAKQFARLQKEGVAKSHPKHYAQCQIYMHHGRDPVDGNPVHRAFYLAVCKDDDQLYAERIHYDPAFAMKLEARAERIIYAQQPPARISDNPTWWECKFCPYYQVCHQRAAPAVHCRTCAHATPERAGVKGNPEAARWSCRLHGLPELGLHEQRQGCQQHRYIPNLVTWAEPVDADVERNAVLYRLTADGRIVENSDDGMSSVELAGLSASTEAVERGRVATTEAA